MSFKIGSNLDLSGATWALEGSIRELKDASSKECMSSRVLDRLQLKDFDVDCVLAAIIADLLRSRRAVKHLVLDGCCGHIDILLTIALTTATAQLESLTIATGKLASDAFCPCARSLGVCLQINSTLTTIKLNASSNTFFTLSAEAARSLEHGMIGNNTLTTFHLENCRFDDRDVVDALSRGIRSLGCLRDVKLRSCFAPNGHPLDDESMSVLIRGLEHNAQLTSLDLSRNKCLSRSLSTLSALLDRTKVQNLDLSCQFIEHEDEYMDLSLLVAALGRTSTLQSLELKFNKLTDWDMAFVAAALTYNTSIKHIGLASNKILNLGMSILSSRIPSMPVLRSLLLTNNDFDEAGAEELAAALKENLVLGRVECTPSSPWSKTIRYYADLNWGGRRAILPGHIPIQASLWPVILARVGRMGNDENSIEERKADVLYYLLRKGPMLFL